jgi:hypothetical protein
MILAADTVYRVIPKYGTGHHHYPKEEAGSSPVNYLNRVSNTASIGILSYQKSSFPSPSASLD